MVGAVPATTAFPLRVISTAMRTAGVAIVVTSPALANALLGLREVPPLLDF